MAFIPHPQASLLELIADRLRRTGMSEWLKLALTVGGFAIVTWSMVQQHEYRLDKIEDAMETHLSKHEEQNTQIQKTLTQIQIELSKLTR
jgi:hypothetical protein